MLQQFSCLSIPSSIVNAVSKEKGNVAPHLITLTICSLAVSSCDNPEYLEICKDSRPDQPIAIHRAIGCRFHTTNDVDTCINADW